MAFGELLELIALLALGYIIGSIPTSIIVGRLHSGVDIRQLGSGNAGATNVIRQFGWAPGLLVFVVDAGKGYGAVILASLLGLDPFGWGGEIAGCSAVAGHIWTLFARFRGGKGVATGVGALLALHPVAGGICMLLFALVVAVTGIVSLASLIATASLPLVLLGSGWLSGSAASRAMFAFAIVTAVMILFAHRSNIARLLRGAESRFTDPDR